MEPAEATANPLGSSEGVSGPPAIVELEGALKGLQDGSLSEQEAAAVMERMMDARVGDLVAGCAEVATDSLAGGSSKGAPLRALKVLGAFILGWFATLFSQVLSGI